MTTTMDQVFRYCPKPNHIKPCWCNGDSRCLGVTKNDSQCRRRVLGRQMLCWQHGWSGVGEETP